MYALFDSGGQRHIVKEGPPHHERDELQRKRFIQRARRAMSALRFRFTSPSRTVDYWVDLLRQERPHHFKHWRISGLCVASAELCVELETRALEVVAVPEAGILVGAAAQEPDENPNASDAIHPQRISDDGLASFWRKRRNEFRTCDVLQEHHSLLVVWYELTDEYRFKSSQESVRAFKAIANRASQGLSKYPAREPSELLARKHLARRSSFLQKPHRGCASILARMAYGEGLKDGIVPVVEPVVRKGILNDRDCAESPTGRKPGDPYTNVDFVYVTGEIENVFEASAKLCEELAHSSGARTRRENRPLIVARRAKQEPAATQPKSVQGDTPVAQPGDVTLIDGKDAVTFRLAEQYLGIGERQRQHLIKGKGRARRCRSGA